MSPRAFAMSVLVILVASSAFVACGGGGGGPPFARTLVPTATPGAAATPTPTVAAAETPTPAPTVTALSLNEYLVLTLRMDADMSRITADLSEALPNLQEGLQFVDAAVKLERALSQLAGEAAETLADLTPPPEAESYHIALLGLFRSLQVVAEEMAAALESGSQSRISAALTDFGTLVSDTAEVGEEGQRLAITALGADGDDPLNAYLISAADTRLEVATALADFGARLQELPASADPADALALLEEVIGMLEGFESRWQGLSPSAEAQDLHQRQAELIAETLAGERLLLTGLQDEDEITLLAASEQLLEVSTQGGRLAADWNELLIEALSR